MFCLIAACLFTALSCDQPYFRNDLEAIKARGELRVISRNNAACYYEGAFGPEGFEYELAQAFAEYLGVELKLVILDSYEDMLSTLLSGKADLIAAGLPATNQLRKHLAFGPGYLDIQQQVVGRRGGPAPKGIEDLSGQPIWVISGSQYEETLSKLKKQHPLLAWMSVSGYEAEELLELAAQGAIPLTIASSDVLALNHRYYPELAVHFTIEKGRRLAWAVAPQNLHIRSALERWFAQTSTNTLLKRLVEHYYGHLEDFDYVDLMRYHRRVRVRLPRYRKYFKTAAEKWGFDWKLVAAQSYQESHWDPKAKSFTGVRGLMMLTLETGRRLKVKNRLDPEQAVHAGARYLASLHRRIDDEVPEPDRTFMALAAYNIGFGHLEDAMMLARRLGKVPNSWHTLRSTLPLLRQKKYYRTLPHGFARGDEPVQYVDRIRTYYEILSLHVERTEADTQNRSLVNEKKALNSENPASM